MKQSNELTQFYIEYLRLAKFSPELVNKYGLCTLWTEWLIRNKYITKSNYSVLKQELLIQFREAKLCDITPFNTGLADYIIELDTNNALNNPKRIGWVHSHLENEYVGTSKLSRFVLWFKKLFT